MEEKGKNDEIVSEVFPKVCIYYGDCPFDRAECQEDNPFYQCNDRTIGQEGKGGRYGRG